MYDNIKEYMITVLRKTEGFDRNDFKNRFDMDIDDVYKEDIKELIAEGFIQDKSGRISLTPKGIDVSNSVLCRLIRLCIFDINHYFLCIFRYPSLFYIQFSYFYI